MLLVSRGGVIRMRLPPRRSNSRQAAKLWTANGHHRTSESGRTPRAREKEERGLVSIILVNHNGLRFLEPFFQSLFQQTYRSLEVLFFDNASTDRSVEYVKTNFPSVRVIELHRNTGFSRPNNMGIKNSHGQYILTLNLDVVLKRHFIQELVKAIKGDPCVGWAAGKMLKLTAAGTTEEIDCLGHHFHRDRYAKETDYSTPFSWSAYSQPRYVFGASACAALYRRAMLEDIAIGGEYFDEDFFAYWEDVDLDWRAQLRGWRCIYVPYAVGYHMRGGSGLHRSPEIAAHNLTNRLLMVIKNDEPMHLAEDAIPFAMRTLVDLIVSLRRSPQALPLALRMLFQKMPRALQKRRVIQLNRRVSSSYVRSLIR
jgi:GT2 family glycosyltransferase